MVRKRPEPSSGGRSFEKKLSELEGIVSRLESGEEPLEESLALFEKGTALIRELAKTLEEAERRVEVLTRDADGKLVLAPFRPGEEGEEEEGEEDAGR